MEYFIIYDDYWGGVSTQLVQYVFTQYVHYGETYEALGSVKDEVLFVSPSPTGPTLQSHIDYSAHSFIGTDGADTLSGTSMSWEGSSAIVPGSQIFGRGGDDVLGGAALLDGGDGNDWLGASNGGILIGGAGDDRLSGSSGADQLAGGTGIDTADYGSATAAVMVNLATGLASDGVENNVRLRLMVPIAH